MLVNLEAAEHHFFNPATIVKQKGSCRNMFSSEKWFLTLTIANFLRNNLVLVIISLKMGSSARWQDVELHCPASRGMQHQLLAGRDLAVFSLLAVRSLQISFAPAYDAEVQTRPSL
jgi:hypothetical protein